MANPVSKTLSTLQSAYRLTKSIADLNEVHAIKSQIGELLAQIISAQESAITAQSDQLSLIERKTELEEKVARLEAWDADKKRYHLTETSGGLLAYALKEQKGSSKPVHMLCTNCFDQGQKSILQKESRNPGRHDVHFCPRCDFEHFSEHTGGRGSEHQR